MPSTLPRVKYIDWLKSQCSRVSISETISYDAFKHPQDEDDVEYHDRDYEPQPGNVKDCKAENQHEPYPDESNGFQRT
jgi:hypothetical protein